MHCHLGFSKIRKWEERSLSLGAREALFASKKLIEEFGEYPSDVTAQKAIDYLERAEHFTWSRRTLRRRFATLRRELARNRRTCACGCRYYMPLALRADAKYLNGTHRLRAFRRARDSIARWAICNKRDSRLNA